MHSVFLATGSNALWDCYTLVLLERCTSGMPRGPTRDSTLNGGDGATWPPTSCRLGSVLYTLVTPVSVVGHSCCAAWQPPTMLVLSVHYYRISHVCARILFAQARGASKSPPISFTSTASNAINHVSDPIPCVRLGNRFAFFNQEICNARQQKRYAD